MADLVKRRALRHRYGHTKRAPHYRVWAGGDVLYDGGVLREAQDRFDDAAHQNYEGQRYVDEVSIGPRNRRRIRSFGPKDHRPNYFHRGHA